MTILAALPAAAGLTAEGKAADCPAPRPPEAVRLSSPALFDLTGLLSGNVAHPPLVNFDVDDDGQITIADAVTLFREEYAPCRRVQRLMGPGITETVGGVAWSADLGVLVSHRGALWALVGDTFGSGIYTPNTAAQTLDNQALDGLALTWRRFPDGRPREFFPLSAGAASTAPSGAIVWDGTLYVFMMDMLDWAPPQPARSVLIRSQDGEASFQEVWRGPASNRMVNVSPARGPHPEHPDQEAVYLAMTGSYRRSPVYLAHCPPASLEDPAQYRYYLGSEGEAPQWGADPSAAVPVIEGVQAGELSLRRCDFVGGWLLSFFDYGGGGFRFWRAPTPWGPWSASRRVFDWNRYDWFDAEWGGPYGGYSDPWLDRGDGQVVYFTLSLWVPYSVFLMESDLRLAFGE